MLNFRKVKQVHFSKKKLKAGSVVSAYQPSTFISAGKISATTTATALCSEC